MGNRKRTAQTDRDRARRKRDRELKKARKAEEKRERRFGTSDQELAADPMSDQPDVPASGEV